RRRRKRRRGARRAAPRALVPTVPHLPAANVEEDRPASAVAAAALSLFLPGVGQIYSGRVLPGIGWLAGTGLRDLLFPGPGVLLPHRLHRERGARPAAAEGSAQLSAVGGQLVRQEERRETACVRPDAALVVGRPRARSRGREDVGRGSWFGGNATTTTPRIL